MKVICSSNQFYNMAFRKSFILKINSFGSFLGLMDLHTIIRTWQIGWKVEINSPQWARGPDLSWINHCFGTLLSLWILSLVVSQDHSNPTSPQPWPLCGFNYHPHWFYPCCPVTRSYWKLRESSQKPAGHRFVVLPSPPPRHRILSNVMFLCLSFLTGKMKIKTPILCDHVNYIATWNTEHCAWHMVNGGFYYFIIDSKSPYWFLFATWIPLVTNFCFVLFSFFHHVTQSLSDYIFSLLNSDLRGCLPGDPSPLWHVFCALTPL